MDSGVKDLGASSRAEAPRTPETHGGDAWLRRECGGAGGMTLFRVGCGRRSFPAGGVSDVPICTLLARINLAGFYRWGDLRLGGKVNDFRDAVVILWSNQNDLRPGVELSTTIFQGDRDSLRPSCPRNKRNCQFPVK